MKIRINGLRHSFRKLILRVVACIIVTVPIAAFAAPAVLYTDIVSGPNTGGENNNGAYLSIFGKGFGVDLSKVKVYVNNGEVVRYMYLGSSLGRPDVQQLSVQLGPNTSTGPIKVVVNGAVSNTGLTFTVRPAKIYFVSLTGSDSSGVVNDISHPFRTPNYVAKSSGSFSPGDFIVVRGGTYVLDDGTNNLLYETWLRFPPNGSATSPSTFMGYPGETVTAKLNSGVEVFEADGNGGSHWVVANISIWLNHCRSNGPLNVGITTTSEVCLGKHANNKATDVRWVNLGIDGHNTGGMCAGGGDSPVVVQYSDHVKVLGLSVHNTSPAVPHQASHVIYLATSQNNTEVGWSALYDIPHSRAVIQVHQDEFSGNCWGKKFLTDIQIHDNLIHDVSGQAILLDGGTGDIQVYNNLIYNNLYTTYNDAIALRGSGGLLNATLYNNTVYADPDPSGIGWPLGFGISGWFPQHVTLYNNIFYVRKPTDRYYGTDGSDSSMQSWIAAGNVTSDYNLWYGSNDAKPSFTGAHELNVDPLFIDTTVGNLRLVSPTSPAIDKGTSQTNTIVTTDFDGNPRPQGNATDLGAFEASGITLPAPQNVTLQKK